MTSKIDVAIIGAGAMGLSVGYNLLLRGAKPLVLEGGYLNAGSTGRNMGILKERLDDENLVRLAVKSMEVHERLPSKLGVNTFYRRSGRLMIARNDEELQQLNERRLVYQRQGVRDAWLSPEDISEKWPYIDRTNLLGGYFDPKEALVHPFALTWAHFEALKKLGGRVEKQTIVKDLRRANGGFSIETNRGIYEAEKLVIAAGFYTSSLLEKLGFKISLRPVRKEVLISEPIKPFLDPVIERKSVEYEMAQTMRGEILGTIGSMPEGDDLSECTLEFLREFACETLKLIQGFKYLRVLRQWVGIIEKTSDGKPIIGSVDDGVYVACGHDDYGLTLAPIVGQLLTENIMDGSISTLLKPFDPKRFN